VLGEVAEGAIEGAADVRIGLKFRSFDGLHVRRADLDVFAAFFDFTKECSVATLSFGTDLGECADETDLSS